MQAPFDGRFKILAEEYPDLLLRLLGILEPGMKPQFVDILRELHLDAVQVDHVYRIGDEETGRLVHLEAITSWSKKRTSRLALYRFLLGQRYKLPIASYVVLMAEKYAPKKLPEKVVYDESDGFRIEAPYRVIRMWEVDASLAFQPGSEPLLPWAPLLKGGVAEFEKTMEEMERLVEHPDKAPYPVAVMVSNLATLASLRYDKGVIRRMVERLTKKMMLDTELFKDSWLYKDGVKAGRKEGRAEGKAEGRAEGKAEGKRDSVRFALRKKFPWVGALPEIDQINSPDVLDELLAAILDARNADEVHAAIAAALRQN